MTPEDLAQRGLRVKGLEWEDHPHAQVSQGTFVNLDEEQQSYWITWCPDGSFALGFEKHPTLEAAKAAAEADHAAMIAAQLEPEP